MRLRRRDLCRQRHGHVQHVHRVLGEQQRRRQHDHGYGGGDLCRGSVTVTSSTFTGCSASGSQRQGGAIYAGSVTVTSSTFTGCSASGGRRRRDLCRGSVTVTSSTFTGCSASGSVDSNGGAIYADSGSTINFCRFYHDTLGTTVYS